MLHGPSSIKIPACRLVIAHRHSEHYSREAITSRLVYCTWWVLTSRFERRTSTYKCWSMFASSSGQSSTGPKSLSYSITSAEQTLRNLIMFHQFVNSPPPHVFVEYLSPQAPGARVLSSTCMVLATLSSQRDPACSDLRVHRVTATSPTRSLIANFTRLLDSYVGPVGSQSGSRASLM